MESLSIFHVELESGMGMDLPILAHYVKSDITQFTTLIIIFRYQISIVSHFENN